MIVGSLFSGVEGMKFAYLLIGFCGIYLVWVLIFLVLFRSLGVSIPYVWFVIAFLSVLSVITRLFWKTGCIGVFDMFVIKGLE